MKRILLIFSYLFCILTIWATQIYLPSYQHVVELQSGDTVRLDTAGTYRFFQTVDTLYDVLILSEVKYVPGDTTIQNIIIENLNIKNHNMSTNTNGNCCVRLEDGSAGIATYLYVEGTNILCPGLAYGYHRPGTIGCGIRINSPVPSTIAGSGALIYAPQPSADFFRPELSGCLIGICANSAECTIAVDSLSTTHSGYFGIQWESNTQMMIQSSKYGGGVKYGGKTSKGAHITVDADSCASLIGAISDSLFVYRGSINSINGFAYAVIGVDYNPNIHINAIGDVNPSNAPLYTKMYSGTVDFYNSGNSKQRLDLHGGTMSKVLIRSIAEHSSDTIFHMNGGTIPLYNNTNNLKICNGSIGRVIIDGGSLLTPTEQLPVSNILCSGIQTDNHIGNIYLNYGEICIPMPNAVHIYSCGFEQDTLFVAKKAIVNHGAGMILRTQDSIINFNSIQTIQQVVSSSENSYNAMIFRTKYIPLLRAFNSTTGDSIYIIDPQGKNNLTFPDIVYDDQYDIWDIYPAYKRIIHYQVGEGIAPEDTTYQEGLVRYFTTVPTRTFYDFVGWYADSTYTIRVDSLDEWSRGDTTLWAKWTHSSEIPSLSVMIAQGNCLVVRNPEGFSEVESAYFTWVHQDTIVVNGMDSIISDTLPSHKMYVEVGDPIPQGRYTAIIRIEEGWTVYVSRYIPATVLPTSSPRNSNKRTLFNIGSYIFGIDDEGKKYLIKP